MSIARLLCTAIATIALISVVWTPVVKLVTTSTLGLVATQDDTTTPNAAQLPPFKPVARVSSLMAGIGSAFNNLRDVLPQTEDEHRLGKIRTWSEVIAELSNVHTRFRRTPEYLAMAADTRSIALELARAVRADTPDEDQLGTLLVNLDLSCSTCHDSDE